MYMYQHIFRNHSTIRPKVNLGPHIFKHEYSQEKKRDIMKGPTSILFITQ